jgi:hypothetical protein
MPPRPEKPLSAQYCFRLYLCAERERVMPDGGQARNFIAALDANANNAYRRVAIGIGRMQRFPLY